MRMPDDKNVVNVKEDPMQSVDVAVRIGLIRIPIYLQGEAVMKAIRADGLPICRTWQFEKRWEWSRIGIGHLLSAPELIFCATTKI